MELSDYRVQIDRIDRQLVELFAQRMETAAGIAAYKKEHGLPVLDPIRERQKLQNVVELAPENMKDYTASLYTLLFELSRGYQNRLLGASTALTAEIQSAITELGGLYRRDEARSRDGSFGLGLSIAETVAKAHGGKIWAEWKEGRITFTAELPCE